MTDRPRIILPMEGKAIGRFAEELGEFFSSKTVMFYRPVEDTVVRLMMREIPQTKKRILVFHEVKKEELISLLETWYEVGIERTADGLTRFKEKSASPTVASVVLMSSQFRDQLPWLKRIYTIPMPRIIENEIVFPEREYDSVFQSWLVVDAPIIDGTMDIIRAKEIIEKIYSEFCFASPQDKVNAVAALVTPLCRGLYNHETCRTPVFFYKANRERAGKDYCAGITGIIYEGSAIEDPAIVTEKEMHDDEFRKKILATFKSGRNRIHSSNNKGHLNSAALESIVTCENWEDRQLGGNQMLMYPNTLEISLSANTGITYTPDLAARCVFVNLFFSSEDPNMRVFKEPNLKEWVTEHRSEILSALYTLVKDWVRNGMVSGSKPFTSFPEWARVVGGIMENAGYGSPCVQNDTSDSVGGDSETREMKKVFEAGFEKWPEQWISKHQIMDEFYGDKCVFEGLFAWFNWGSDTDKARMKFGRLFDKFIGRELSNILLEAQRDNLHPSRNHYKWSKMVGVVGLVCTTNPPHCEVVNKYIGVEATKPTEPTNPNIIETKKSTETPNNELSQKPIKHTLELKSSNLDQPNAPESKPELDHSKIISAKEAILDFMRIHSSIASWTEICALPFPLDYLLAARKLLHDNGDIYLTKPGIYTLVRPYQEEPI
jgi:hypothetical protein